MPSWPWSSSRGLRFRSHFVTIALFVLSSSSQASEAHDCPPAEVEGARVAVLDLVERIELEADRAGIWTTAWIGEITGSLVAQVGVIAFVDPEDRPDLYVGAVSSAIGVVALLADPLDVIEHGQTIRADAARLVAGLGPCSARRELEALLAADAEEAREAAAWPMHLGNILFNLVTAAIVGFGFGHWQSAAINFGAGTLIGEIMLFSQPNGLVRDPPIGSRMSAFSFSF
ncbi:MAG: hypothetical protein HYV07_06685 [Deltaproteobacteria bacterium]|nr:hypothetical protein [Deltaproteobacteria bacterium]